MSSVAYTRRACLHAFNSLGALIAFGALGGCERLQEAIANRPTRRRAGTPGAAADEAIYARAVAAMRALPANDPRNWERQAEIHLNHCPHGNWFFLPWHRAYLWYFERICRDLTGEPRFALPYWNWQVNGAIPAAFWTGHLAHSPRFATQTSQASTDYVGQNVIETIVALTNFEQFASYSANTLRPATGYGQLEATPHNNIHGFVGGTMGGFLSPRDPVFWAHHNMIDFAWTHWNVQRGNLNTNDSAWTTFDLAGMFVDESGAAASITCGATVILPLIFYQFEDSAIGNHTPPLGQLVAQAVSREALEQGGNIRHQIRLRQVTEVGATLDVTRAVTVPLRLPGGLDVTAAATGDERVLVRAAVVPPDDDSTYVRVFINAPEATARTDLDDPHYAGSFGFFTHSSVDQHAHGPQDFFIDVTDTLTELRARGLFTPGEDIDLTLVTVPHERRPRPGAIGLLRLELVTTPAAVVGR
jgi:tyrosinase